MKYNIFIFYGYIVSYLHIDIDIVGILLKT